MKIITESIPLNPNQATAGTPIKRGALVAFRALRVAISQAKTVPALVAEAATDIRDAWEESASPKP